MERPGICVICGGEANPAYSCSICGAIVCKSHFDNGFRICTECKTKAGQ